jgi:N-acetyl-anhydromuramoyl-L-alanine amidase
VKNRLSKTGILVEARYLPSPNRDARDAGVQPELLVIHNISLPPGEFGGSGVIDLFLNRLDSKAHPYYTGIAHLRVSAHFLIRRDGEVIQFVPCSERAWHAGVSNWRGRGQCNDFSIGVELEGTDAVPFTDEQYAQLAMVTQVLRAHYPIADVAGHSDIAPNRKTDPGPYFDWIRYRDI